MLNMFMCFCLNPFPPNVIMQSPHSFYVHMKLSEIEVRLDFGLTCYAKLLTAVTSRFATLTTANTKIT